MAGLYQFKIPTDVPLYKQVEFAKNHWKTYGCREGRVYDCLKPPSSVGEFKYRGAYLDDYNSRVIPNYRGKVKSLQQCKAKAEKYRERVFGLTNFLGLIYFFEKVPNPRISTFSSKATASVIELKITSIASVISDLLRFGNSFFRDSSISDLVKVSFFELFTQL